MGLKKTECVVVPAATNLAASTVGGVMPTPTPMPMPVPMAMAMAMAIPLFLLPVACLWFVVKLSSYGRAWHFGWVESLSHVSQVLIYFLFFIFLFFDFWFLFLFFVFCRRLSGAVVLTSCELTVWNDGETVLCRVAKLGNLFSTCFCIFHRYFCKNI